MAALWLAVRGWFARVGSDPFYTSYERSLGNIKQELDRLQAIRAARARAWAAVRARFWGGFAAAYALVLSYAAYVNRQPPGSYTHRQQAARVSPVLLAPVGAWVVHRLLAWLQAALDRRSAARSRQLEAKLRKQVAELKDSTRVERTLGLLKKYDPDYAPPAPPPRARLARGAAGPGGRQQGQAAGPQTGAAAGGTAGGNASSLASGVASGAMNAGSSSAKAAGALLAQIYSRAAGTLIADDPVTLGLLREAQQQADLLRDRLVQSEARTAALLQQNIVLKEQLGLPTEEERRVLAGEGCGAMPLAAQAAGGRGGEEQQQQGGEEAEGEAANATAAVEAAAEGAQPEERQQQQKLPG